jgi:hypothetical protein
MQKIEKGIRENRFIFLNPKFLPTGRQVNIETLI